MVDSNADGRQVHGPTARYSPMTVAVMLQLPSSSARDFLVASALGRFVHKDDPRRPLRSGKDAGGTEITLKHRDDILQNLGLEVRRWFQLCEQWESKGLAHRCRRGVICLFATTVPERCPACGAGIMGFMSEPGPAIAQLENGNSRIIAVETRASLQSRSRITAVETSETRESLRFSHTDSEQGASGSQRGDAVGLGEDLSLEEEQRRLQLVKDFFGGTEAASA